MAGFDYSPDSRDDRRQRARPAVACLAPLARVRLPIRHRWFREHRQAHIRRGRARPGRAEVSPPRFGVVRVTAAAMVPQCWRHGNVFIAGFLEEQRAIYRCSANWYSII